MVERVLGKDEVTGSIPVNGSISSNSYLGRLNIGPFLPYTVLSHPCGAS